MTCDAAACFRAGKTQQTQSRDTFQDWSQKHIKKKKVKIKISHIGYVVKSEMKRFPFQEVELLLCADLFHIYFLYDHFYPVDTQLK